MDPKAEFVKLIEDITFYADIFILICLLIIEGLVFYRLKFKVDKSGLLTLVLHLVISILRIADDFFKVFKAISSMLVWISLHYFTFEMWYIKAMLTSESYQISLRNKNKISKIKIAVAVNMSILLFLYTVNDSYATLLNSYQFYKDNAKTFSLIFLLQ